MTQAKICILIWFLFLKLISSRQLVDFCHWKPFSQKAKCLCDEALPEIILKDKKGIRVFCKNLEEVKELHFEHLSSPDTYQPNSRNATFDIFKDEFKARIIDISIVDSNFECIDLVKQFETFKNLKHLSINRSNLKAISKCGDKDNSHKKSELSNSTSRTSSKFPRLKILDLSENKLETIENEVLEKFSSIEVLNISYNRINFIDRDFFRNTKNLNVVDLSSNFLSKNLNPFSLRHLPQRLAHIDISNNSWTCSPELAWLYVWALPYIESGAIANINITRCNYEGTIHDAKLFLVMEYYTKQVLPECPIKDHCDCFIENIQDKIVVSTERHYAVFVSCPDKGLKRFPNLPKHTRTLDLSRNLLTNEALNHLRVSDQNYKEVENLTLNNNLLKTLPDSLLEMKLGISFSAKNNQLTSMSYDFSQHLLKATNVIELSDNPWICSCNSQITDLNLLSKIRDRWKIVCGAGSDLGVVEKQIYLVNQEVLCPPETDDELKELLLQLLCVGLTFLIVVLLTNSLVLGGKTYKKMEGENMIILQTG